MTVTFILSSREGSLPKVMPKPLCVRRLSITHEVRGHDTNPSNKGRLFVKWSAGEKDSLSPGLPMSPGGHGPGRGTGGVQGTQDDPRGPRPGAREWTPLPTTLSHRPRRPPTCPSQNDAAVVTGAAKPGDTQGLGNNGQPTCEVAGVPSRRQLPGNVSRLRLDANCRHHQLRGFPVHTKRDGRRLLRREPGDKWPN
jgi:hypothetical protein